MGITKDEYVVDMLNHHRRRRHKVQILNKVEDEIEALRRRV